MHLVRLFVALLSPGLMSPLFAQNQAPQISIQHLQIDEAQQRITLTYDLSDAEGDSMEVWLLAAPAGNQRFALRAQAVSGDAGFPVLSGSGRSLSWDYAGQLSDQQAYDLKLVADDRYVIPIEELVAQVDSQRLRERLQQIDGPRHYVTEPGKLAASRDSIEAAFEQYQLEHFRQAFPFQGTTGENIIGNAWGSYQADSVILIDGHYDTVADAHGADDNGSAVVGMLEAARILSQYRFRKSLRFVGFDLEEAGLIGSQYYVNNRPANETIEGVLNLEMIGFYSDQPNTQTLPFGFAQLYPAVAQAIAADSNRGNFLTNTAVSSFPALQQAFDSSAARYVPDLRVITIVAQASFVPPDLLRSDHAPFWGAGIPALMLTDGANFRNPHYHEPSDSIGTLDFRFMQQNVQATVATAAMLAQPLHSGEAVYSNLLLTHFEDLHQLPCGFVLAPNPASQSLQLRFPDCTETFDLRIEWLDQQGRRLQHFDHDTRQGDWELDVRSYPRGVYWLRLSDGHHYSTRKVLLR